MFHIKKCFLLKKWFLCRKTFLQGNYILNDGGCVLGAQEESELVSGLWENMLRMMAALDSREDKKKVELLYEKYSRLIYLVAYNILHNREDTEDVVSESWEKIIRNLDKINEIDCKETKSYLVIIVERTAIDYYRKKKRNYERQEIVEEWETSPYFATRDQKLEKAEMLLWLRELPKKYSEVLLLHYGNDLSAKEIAKVLGITVNSVYARLHRAHQYIREHYDQ